MFITKNILFYYESNVSNIHTRSPSLNEELINIDGWRPHINILSATYKDMFAIIKTLAFVCVHILNFSMAR